MPSDNTGRTLKLQPDSVYIRMYLTDDMINYWTVNTLEPDNENSVMLACLGRGMIEHARKNQVELVRLGSQALREEGKIVEAQKEEKEMVETVSGLIIPFPKVRGNA